MSAQLTAGQWSRPASLLMRGVRPNSPQTITVTSFSRPRTSRSSSSALSASGGGVVCVAARSTLSVTEFMHRVARRTVGLLSEMTDEGFVFRVDTRLRPDGDAVPSGASSFVTTIDLVGGRARSEWVRDLTMPVSRVYKYSEVVTPDAGYINGIDSSGRTMQSRDSNPPQHTMSGQRIAVALRELQRSSPQLLITMRADPHSLKMLPAAFAGGKRMSAVEYDAQVVFVLDGKSLFDQQALHQAAFGARLVRLQRHAEDGVDEVHEK